MSIDATKKNIEVFLHTFKVFLLQCNALKTREQKVDIIIQLFLYIIEHKHLLHTDEFASMRPRLISKIFEFRELHSNINDDSYIRLIRILRNMEYTLELVDTCQAFTLSGKRCCRKMMQRRSGYMCTQHYNCLQKKIDKFADCIPMLPKSVSSLVYGYTFVENN